MTDEKFILTEDAFEAFRQLPLPLYLADECGNISFISPELESILGRRPGQVTELYFDESDLIEMRLTLNRSRKSAEKVVFTKANGAPIYVQHTVKRFISGADDSKFVDFGYVESLSELEILRNEVKTYRTILDHPEIPIGVHVIDSPVDESGARIVWMNRTERRDLRLPGIEELTVKSIVPADKENDAANSVQSKFQQGGQPADFRPREFALRDGDGNKSDQDTIPVRIKDYFVYAEPARDNRLPSRIITIVFPMSLDSDLVNFLSDRGVKNPEFLPLGIRAAEKSQRGQDKKIVFVYVNKLFGDDVRQLDGKSDLTDEVLSAGKLGDVDVFGPEVGARFHADDFSVLATGRPIQGIEPHPYEQNTEDYVQFIKIPITTSHGERGLVVFYWPCSLAADVRRQLSNFLRDQGKRVVEDLPNLFQIVRKNKEKKFIYVNPRFLIEHGGEMSDFVGKTDEEVHGDPTQERLVAEYRSDDDRVINDGDVVARVELHQAGVDSEKKEVLVIKTPVVGPKGIEGEQVVFWYTDELKDSIEKTRARDAKDQPNSDAKEKYACDIFVSYPRQDREFMVGRNRRFERTIDGFQIYLEMLKTLHKRTYWFDEHRTEDQIEDEIKARIRVTKVFVIMKSPALFASKFIMTKELPWIRERKESDPTVRILPVILKSCDTSNSTDPNAMWLNSFGAINQGKGKFSEPASTMMQNESEGELWQAIYDQVLKFLQDEAKVR